MNRAPFEQSTALAALPAIRHGFFGRKGCDAELNVSATFAAANEAANNRRLALGALGAGDKPLARLTQVHSTRVVTVVSETDADSQPEADGVVTALPGLALGIITADCAPILFADPDAGVIGACHAGWKGAVGGIAAKTVAAMLALGATRARIAAAIGPTISGVNYEVGPEFADALEAADPLTAPFIFTPNGGRAHFDLPMYLEAQLSGLGLGVIGRAGGCTYADPARYFSHRYSVHNDVAEGRQIAVVLRD